MVLEKHDIKNASFDEWYSTGKSGHCFSTVLSSARQANYKQGDC